MLSYAVDADDVVELKKITGKRCAFEGMSS